MDRSISGRGQCREYRRNHSQVNATTRLNEGDVRKNTYLCSASMNNTAQFGYDHLDALQRRRFQAVNLLSDDNFERQVRGEDARSTNRKSMLSSDGLPSGESINREV